MPTLSRRTALASLLLAGAAAGHAWAETWPTRPVTVIVPFPTGASTDVVARLLAEKLRSELGQPFVVENKPGAGGNLAATGVARAAPDGYTLFITSAGPIATNKLLYKKLPFDPLTDFEPIALVGDVNLGVLVNKTVPATTLAELLDYARANPGKLSLGSPGFGLMGHITGETLQRRAGVQMTHVPYRGSAPLAQDLVGGQVNVAIDFLPGYLPLIGEGGVRVLAVTADERSAQLPNVPTLAEAGLPGINASSWFAVVGPKGLPADIVTRVGRIVTAYVLSPEGRAKLEPIGVRPIGGGPDAVRKAQADEITKWQDTVKAANISLD